MSWFGSSWLMLARIPNRDSLPKDSRRPHSESRPSSLALSNRGFPLLDTTIHVLNLGILWLSQSVVLTVCLPKTFTCWFDSWVTVFLCMIRVRLLIMAIFSTLETNIKKTFMLHLLNFSTQQELWSKRLFMINLNCSTGKFTFCCWHSIIINSNNWSSYLAKHTKNFFYDNSVEPCPADGSGL